MSGRNVLQEMILRFKSSLQDGSFIKLSLGNYKGAEKDLKNVYARKILVKKEEVLSFTYRYQTRDIVKNYPLDEAAERVETFLNEGFQAATLFTTVADFIYDCKKIIKKPPSQSEISLDHNRAKKRPVAAEKSYLHDLGVTDASGNVLKNAQDKYRQINKYVEILGALVKNLPPEKIRKVADMGSGKGYLTFALYDYLTGAMGFKPDVTGVEHRADLVALCNGIAKKSGFDGLSFVEGTIEKYDAADTNILIALHACDTATDDAIAKGIAAGAELIVTAPCCHKQIRREMEKGGAVNELDFLLKHGIFMERQAEMVTDGIRALILEYFGYSTKVFEFISDAHTPKNVLIVGTKNSKAKIKNPEILEKIKSTKEYFGISRHHLEDAAGLSGC